MLLVDDNPGDQRLTQKAFEAARFDVDFFAVSNGEEAFQFLRKEGEYANAPRPDIIFLDLNMPVMDGREFLRQVKVCTEYASIPVIVLSTSSAAYDIDDSYLAHANCYLIKPVSLSRFFDIVSSTGQFWLRTARLPCPA